jgi:hypothetical protein
MDNRPGEQRQDNQETLNVKLEAFRKQGVFMRGTDSPVTLAEPGFASCSEGDDDRNRA